MKELTVLKIRIALFVGAFIHLALTPLIWLCMQSIVWLWAIIAVCAMFASIWLNVFEKREAGKPQ